MARVKNLVTVNGSLVRIKEREDAEKLYLKQIVVEAIKQHPELSPEALKDMANIPVDLHVHPRYNELLSIHGVPVLAANLIGGKDSANTLIDEVISKWFSNTALVRHIYMREFSSNIDCSLENAQQFSS